MIVYIDETEKDTLKSGVEEKYIELHKSEIDYLPLIRTTYKDAFTNLADSIARKMKPFKMEKKVVGYPKEAFFVNLFDRSKEMKSRYANINACYLYAFGQTREVYLASHKCSPISDSFAESYVVRLARHEDIRKIANLAATVYSGIDVIPYSTMLEWYEKNPCSFYVIENQDGNIVGNLDILPLKDEVLKEFLGGRLIERKIKGSDIWGREENENVEDLYIESVVNLGGRTAIIELLKIMPSIVMNFGCSYNSIKNLYCVSASHQGSQLITKLGFKEILSDLKRLDEHRIYVGKVTDVFNALYQIFAQDRHSAEFIKKLSDLLNGTALII